MQLNLRSPSTSKSASMPSGPLAAVGGPPPSAGIVPPPPGVLHRRRGGSRAPCDGSQLGVGGQEGGNDFRRGRHNPAALKSTVLRCDRSPLEPADKVLQGASAISSSDSRTCRPSSPKPATSARAPAAAAATMDATTGGGWCRGGRVRSRNHVLHRCLGCCSVNLQMRSYNQSNRVASKTGGRLSMPGLDYYR
jgi:hypothetical protein